MGGPFDVILPSEKHFCVKPVMTNSGLTRYLMLSWKDRLTFHLVLENERADCREGWDITRDTNVPQKEQGNVKFPWNENHTEQLEPSMLEEEICEHTNVLHPHVVEPLPVKNKVLENQNRNWNLIGPKSYKYIYWPIRFQLNFDFLDFIFF